MLVAVTAQLQWWHLENFDLQHIWKFGSPSPVSQMIPRKS
jgi:hypothetical protein